MQKVNSFVQNKGLCFGLEIVRKKVKICRISNYYFGTISFNVEKFLKGPTKIMKRKQKENKIVVQECFFVSMGLAQVYGKVQLYEKLVIYCLCQENKTYF